MCLTEMNRQLNAGGRALVTAVFVEAFGTDAMFMDLAVRRTE
jgi:hypothetical protein